MLRLRLKSRLTRQNKSRNKMAAEPSGYRRRSKYFPGLQHYYGQRLPAPASPMESCVFTHKLSLMRPPRFKPQSVSPSCSSPSDFLSSHHRPPPFPGGGSPVAPYEI